MLYKSLKLFPIVIVLTLMSLLVVGCGKQGSRFGNHAPSIAITSYEGYDPLNPYTDSTSVTLFQQRIFWNASDNDGVITGYAYRILDKLGNPMSTSGNTYIDTNGDVTPAKVLEKYGPGWVLHYKQGAVQDYPLDDARAKRTIWTTNKYAMVNFLASTATGEPDTTISRFEVICVDNRGEVCETLAYRKFKSYSGTPTCFLSTTKGDPDGDEVGTGLRLSFTLDDSDPFIQPTAWYYRFKVQKMNAADSTFISEMPNNGWATTKGQTKINQYLITKYTNPSISSDYNSSGGQPTFTQVIAQVVDLAGIISQPDTIRFVVKEGFHPATLIHLKRVYALGSYHNINYTDDSTPEVWPYIYENGSQLFATPFFRDVDGYYTAIKSNNLKSWIRWGWHGEYGVPEENGNHVTDDPYDKKIDLLLDENTNKNYYSEITHFDIRLDGQPYDYPPFRNSIVEDAGTNKRWLRVPVNSSLGQTIVLTNLAANTPDNPYHYFEVRAVDLQGEVDPTPAEFKFKVLNQIPKAQQSGILVIDDDNDHVNTGFAPPDSVDNRYASMLSNYANQVTLVKTDTLTTNHLMKDIKSRMFATSDLQKYKLVIIHSDAPGATSQLQYENDGLALYLKLGGNVLISGGGNLSPMLQEIMGKTFNTLYDYFGVPRDKAAVSSMFNGTNPIQSPFFIKGKSLISGYNDLSLAFDLDVNNPQPQPFIESGVTVLADPNEKNMINAVNSVKGVGLLTKFTSLNNGASYLYSYGSKPVHATAPYNFPNQTQYNTFNDTKVAIKKTTAQNQCYIFGFPLSYMVKSDAKNLMNKIINDVLSR